MPPLPPPLWHSCPLAYHPLSRAVCVAETLLSEPEPPIQRTKPPTLNSDLFLIPELAIIDASTEAPSAPHP
ncbi:hypothetical protein DL89DRAFT_264810 [Linderina pennispora]|uniref:Uncharacterized protein n=1 Tax=Linderina pennispora TaxID=61395 RepID=A0A1Y1WNQ9_9FUNG|nr:uncharacterized protein DL89DRAFT_264810 [Linderina pennispora]ORX75015.1 hypothetical protein DL89DRAFT_264810 [Linderina pennispora]